MHLLEPSMLLHVPGPHFSQGGLGGQNERRRRGEPLPNLSENVPAGQPKHDVLPSSSLNSPAGHGSQLVRPPAELKLPAKHPVQGAMLGTASSIGIPRLYRPALQS